MKKAPTPPPTTAAPNPRLPTTPSTTPISSGHEICYGG